MNMISPKGLFCKLFFALVLPLTAYSASLKKVTGAPGTPAYDGAINHNFDKINSELSNTVHKTSTETIVGYKYFDSPVSFGSLTASTLTVNTSASFNTSIDMNSNKITELTNGSASSDAAAFGQIPSAATQANQETATSTTVFVTPGRQQYHTSSPKAWVSFSSTGTLRVRASYNVSSVTDNSVGNHTINFTTGFSSVDYGCLVSSKALTGSGAAGLSFVVSQTTGSYRFVTTDAAPNSIDVAFIDVVCFGDQ